MFEDLNGVASYRTVERWCKIIRKTGAIDLLKLSDCHRTAGMKAPIQKIKGFLAENWRLKWACRLS